MNKKRILLIVLVLALIGGGIAAWQWYKPHPQVEDEKGISITAMDLFKEYTENEKGADARYLKKALEVSGVIASEETNQDGQLVLILQTDDAIFGVKCTMRDKQVSAKTGDSVTAKGYCSGFVSDVILTDCVLKK